MTKKKRSATVGLGDRMKAAREAKGWSLADAAKHTGYSRSGIHAIEQGRRKNPREIMAIAEAYDEDPGYLLFGVRNLEKLVEALDPGQLETVLEIPDMEEWQIKMVLDLIQKLSNPPQQ